MALLQNEQYNFVFGKTVLNGKTTITLNRAEGNSAVVSSVRLNANEAAQPLKLKIAGDGRYYDFMYAIGNGEWQILARGVDAVNLSTHRSGGFIGACIALYATSNNK